MHYDTPTLEQTIVQLGVMATQVALQPQMLGQMQELGKQLQAAQEQLKTCGEAIDAKNKHIEARNAENTALKTKIDALVAKFGPAATDLLASLEAAPAPVESEGGETA